MAKAQTRQQIEQKRKIHWQNIIRCHTVIHFILSSFFDL